MCTAGKIRDKEGFAQFLHNVKPGLEEKAVNFVQVAADEAYTKGLGDREQAIQQGMKKGMEKGMEKGIEKGMEKGMERGKIEVAQRLLTNSTPEAIAQLLDWPVEKIELLAKRLTETV